MSKICKGNGKAKGFGCSKPLPFTERNKIKSYKAKYGLGIDCGCYRNWMISGTKDADLEFQRFLKVNKSNFEKEQKKKEKERKNEIIDWKPKLQTKINFIVRLLDIGLPCLARNYHPGQMQAGHVFARGGNQYIRYNLHNIHRQSAQSNGKQNDDGLLREGLVNEYGQSYMDFISNLRQTPKPEYMNHEYMDFTRHASSIANELKRQGRIFPTTEERIYMRNEINNQLGIYDQKYCEFKINDQ